MSNIIDKVKGKLAPKHDQTSSSQEQQYSIQPHPAKTNDPADLTEGPQLGGGLNSNPEAGAFHARGPYVPPRDLTDGLEQPQSREELRARSADLNRGQ
ncbi:hypothetical protein BC834DRAFT_874326 [Gloeopeniophorella convolvens]|nr:hypothetical protein BC834DRAFT_874326 [Gloeopeniophorella convolvens]